MGRLSKIFDQAKDDANDKESTKARNNEFVNLNFKVDVDIRRKLKQYAAQHDLSLKEVFELAINFYIDNNP